MLLPEGETNRPNRPRQPGVRLELVVMYQTGEKHLPIIARNRAA